MKYITLSIPDKDPKTGKWINWWVPDENNIGRAIEIMEEDNPGYKFHQIVTSPGNGGYREFAIMKKKKEKIKSAAVKTKDCK